MSLLTRKHLESLRSDLFGPRHPCKDSFVITVSKEERCHTRIETIYWLRPLRHQLQSDVMSRVNSSVSEEFSRNLGTGIVIYKRRTLFFDKNDIKMVYFINFLYLTQRHLKIKSWNRTCGCELPQKVGDIQLPPINIHPCPDGRVETYGFFISCVKFPVWLLYSLVSTGSPDDFSISCFVVTTRPVFFFLMGKTNTTLLK